MRVPEVIMNSSAGSRNGVKVFWLMKIAVQLTHPATIVFQLAQQVREMAHFRAVFSAA